MMRSVSVGPLTMRTMAKPTAMAAMMTTKVQVMVVAAFASIIFYLRKE